MQRHDTQYDVIYLTSGSLPPSFPRPLPPCEMTHHEPRAPAQQIIDVAARGAVCARTTHALDGSGVIPLALEHERLLLQDEGLRA